MTNHLTAVEEMPKVELTERQRERIYASALEVLHAAVQLMDDERPGIDVPTLARDAAVLALRYGRERKPCRLCGGDHVVIA